MSNLSEELDIRLNRLFHRIVLLDIRYMIARERHEKWKYVNLKYVVKEKYFRFYKNEEKRKMKILKMKVIICLSKIFCDDIAKNIVEFL